MKKKKSISQNKKRKIIIAVYFALRVLILISLIGQAIRGNWNNVFLCVVALLLYTLPNVISDKFNITFPTTLEVIVYLFIYAAAILGEIQNFYGIFEHWDTMLHTLNGFLCAAIGFSLVDILNNNDSFHIDMTPAFVALVACCFSVTIGVLWEFGEFAVDQYLNKDMQKDRIVRKIASVKLNPDGSNPPVVIDNIDETIIYSNNHKNTLVIEGGYLELGVIDTMKDLFVSFIGAITFSTIGYLYIKNRDSYQLVEIFLPTRNKKEE